MFEYIHKFDQYPELGAPILETTPGSSCDLNLVDIKDNLITLGKKDLK